MNRLVPGNETVLHPWLHHRAVQLSDKAMGHACRRPDKVSVTARMLAVPLHMAASPCSLHWRRWLSTSPRYVADGMGLIVSSATSRGSGLYLLSFSSPKLSPSLLQPPPHTEPMTPQPGNPAHQPPGTLFASPWSAGALELARANKIDSTVPWIITGVSFPIMAIKQFIKI